MNAERADTATAELEGMVVERCGCGRLATALCWLGEESPARWLFPCGRRRRLPPDTPEAA